jgi:hypothetical protein
MGHYESDYRSENTRLQSAVKGTADDDDGRFAAEHIIASVVAVVFVGAEADDCLCHTSPTFDSLVLCRTIMIDGDCDQPKVTAHGVGWT